MFHRNVKQSSWVGKHRFHIYIDGPRLLPDMVFVELLKEAKNNLMVHSIDN